MQIIKRIIVREFFTLSPEIKKKDFFVETIGNAIEKVIRKYVQNQLIELACKEINSEQLNFLNPVA